MAAHSPPTSVPRESTSGVRDPGAALSALATQALLGTERRPAPPVHLAGPVGAFLAALAAVPATGADAPPDAPLEAAPAETRILRQAGALGVCLTAGALPGTAPVASVPPDPEPRAIAGAEWEGLLAPVLVQGAPLLVAEALNVLRQRGEVLPPALLPVAIELAGRVPALQGQMAGALGARGRWLAAQMPAGAAWSKLGKTSAAVTDEMWGEATTAQRASLLARWRRFDPAGALARLAEALAVEGARERAALLPALRVGLGPDDEPLVEAALADRGREARQAAQALACAMPQSAYAQRMAARLAGCVFRAPPPRLTSVAGTESASPAGSGAAGSAGWQLEAPAEFDPSWGVDLEPKPTSTTFAARAWWLFQLVRATPLGWWTEHTGLSPREVLRWVRGTDWRAPAEQGLAAALMSQRDVAWARAWLSGGGAALRESQEHALLSLLPAEEAEAAVARVFDEVLSARKRPLVVAMAYARQTRTAAAPLLSPGLARHALGVLRTYLAGIAPNPGDWDLVASLDTFVALLPPEVLAEARAPWAVSGHMEAHLGARWDRFLATLETRARLHALRPPPGTASPTRAADADGADADGPDAQAPDAELDPTDFSLATEEDAP